MTESSENGTQTGELPLAVRVAARLRRMVDFVGRYAAWLSLPVVAITSLDVIGRKLAYEAEDGSTRSLQIWLAENLGSFFQSTKLQELEWHFHAALFALRRGAGGYACAYRGAPRQAPRQAGGSVGDNVLWA